MPRRPARPFRAARFAFDRLEERLALTAGIDPVEVYSWQIINTMRADPARFAADIQALHDGAAGTYQGYSASDPVWADLRDRIDQGQGKNGWNLGSMLTFLGSQPKLPALLLQEDLTAQASAHTEWMEAHGYAHSGTTTQGSALPGFSATPDAQPDPYDHDTTRYAGPRGEDIGYAYDTDWAFEAPYKAGSLSRDGYLQRLAYYSTMTYILDIGLPDLGHLRNLLGRPDGMPATSGSMSITNFDSIGLDQTLLAYQQDADVPNYYLSTHRLDNVRDNGPKAGQYGGLSFADANQNGLYDVGESYQLTAAPIASSSSTPVSVTTPSPTPTPITSPSPASKASTVVSATVPTAPAVVSFRAIRARKKGLTGVVVAYDQAMDSADVTSLGSYSLVAALPGKKARPRPVRLSRATYDPTSNTVTLTLAKPYKAARPLRLTVSASGVAAANGLAPAGDYAGLVRR